MILKKLPIVLIILVLISTSWFKAGMVGEWFLFTVEIIILIICTSLVKTTHPFKYCLKAISPIILLTLFFTISYFNPSYKTLTLDDWSKLSLEKVFSNETNIQKVIFASESFKNVFILSKNNQQLALTTFFDFKNRFYDKFRNNSSPVDKLISKYENLITLKYNTHLPTISLKNSKLIFDYSHKIIQLFIGILAFLIIRKRNEIRLIFYFLCINTGLLAIVGIWQKFNYQPSDNLLEILGIWDTPEPRYYFSTFTYKNHWSCFALISICASLSLLYGSFRRYGYEFVKIRINIALLISFCVTIVSIPLSGSRSGSILLILTGIIFLVFFVFLMRKKSFKKITLLLTTLIAVLASSILFTKFYHKNTWIEMSSNIDSQINQFNKDKLPLRVLLWKDLLNQIYAKPIYGYGFDSYRSINPIYQSTEVRNLRDVVRKNAHQNYIPLIRYGHNDWLEKFSEFGLLGFLILTPYLVIIMKQLIFTKSISAKMFLLGSIIFLLYSVIDFPSQNPACLLLFSLITGCAIKYSLLSKNYL